MSSKPQIVNIFVFTLHISKFHQLRPEDVINVMRHKYVTRNFHNFTLPPTDLQNSLCGNSPSYLNRPDKHRDKKTHKHISWKHHLAIAGDENL